MENKIVFAILNKHEHFIRRHLVLTSPLVEKLHASGVLTNVATNIILEERTQNQLTVLIYLLRKRNLQVLYKFLRVLSQSLDRWIAEKILDTKLTDLDGIGLKTSSVVTVNDLFGKLWQTDVAFHQESVIITSDHRLKDGIKMIGSGIDYNNFKEKQPRSHKSHSVDVPRKVNRLYSYFEKQKATYESKLSGLKKEELFIKEALVYNIKKQKQLRQNQDVLADINRRLQHINFQAGQLLHVQPVPFVQYRKLGDKIYYESVPRNKRRS